MIQSGKAIALAISDKDRSPALQGIPTMAESGLPGYDVTGWNAVFAPAGTPPGIVQKLNAAINQVLAQKQTEDRFLSLGVRPIGCSPEELQQSVVKDIAMIGAALKQAGYKPQ
jgi:tripartite-type tricarboxylate transporter receptor subunit TctC